MLLVSSLLNSSKIHFLTVVERFYQNLSPKHFFKKIGKIQKNPLKSGEVTQVLFLLTNELISKEFAACYSDNILERNLVLRINLKNSIFPRFRDINKLSLCCVYVYG